MCTPTHMCFYNKCSPFSRWRSKGLQCPVIHLPSTREKHLALTFNKWMDYIANNKMAKYRHSLWIKHCLTLHDANLFRHILMIVLWLCPSECFLIVQWLPFTIQLIATVKCTVIHVNTTYATAHTQHMLDVDYGLYGTGRQTNLSTQVLINFNKDIVKLSLLGWLEILSVEYLCVYNRCKNEVLFAFPSNKTLIFSVQRNAIIFSGVNLCTWPSVKTGSFSQDKSNIYWMHNRKRVSHWNRGSLTQKINSNR